MVACCVPAPILLFAFLQKLDIYTEAWPAAGSDSQSEGFFAFSWSLNVPDGASVDVGSPIVVLSCS